MVRCLQQRQVKVNGENVGPRKDSAEDDGLFAEAAADIQNCVCRCQLFVRETQPHVSVQGDQFIVRVDERAIVIPEATPLLGKSPLYRLFARHRWKIWHPISPKLREDIGVFTTKSLDESSSERQEDRNVVEYWIPVSRLCGNQYTGPYELAAVHGLCGNHVKPQRRI
jgi:hypothetical protein